MAMDEPAWDAFTRGSAIRRAGFAGFRRNVAVALGNWGSEAALPALGTALDDPHPIVRGHAAWALGRIGTARAAALLESRWRVEEDVEVRRELQEALDGDGTRATGERSTRP
jgi:epoxyqueuosine reductase